MQILTTVKNFESFEKLSEKIGCKSFQKDGGDVGVKGLEEDFQKLSVLVWEDFPIKCD